MSAIVIYEEEYELYGEHYARRAEAVMIQAINESDEVFDARVAAAIDSMESMYSYFDSESIEIL